MCIKTAEALRTVRVLIKDDVDECCEASMDKESVTKKLKRLLKYIEKINKKENPVDSSGPFGGYYG